MARRRRARCSAPPTPSTRPTPRAEYHRVFTADGGAALTGGLNWYRANHFDAPRAAPITAPTLYVWSTDDVALGREAAEGTAARGRPARTASRCSTA